MEGADRAAAADSLAQVRAHSRWKGQAEFMASLMRRTETLARAPILDGLRRMVAQLALLARMVAGAVRSANGSSWHSLMAVLHLATGAREVLIEALCRPGLGIERGNGEARVGLALCPLGLGHDPAATTRRRQPQLLRVVHRKSLKRRAGR